MAKITKCERALWGALTAVAAIGTVTLVALGVLRTLKPVIAYSSAGGATLLSLAFISRACRRSLENDVKPPIRNASTDRLEVEELSAAASPAIARIESGTLLATPQKLGGEQGSKDEQESVQTSTPSPIHRTESARSLHSPESTDDENGEAIAVRFLDEDFLNSPYIRQLARKPLFTNHTIEESTFIGFLLETDREDTLTEFQEVINHDRFDPNKRDVNGIPLLMLLAQVGKPKELIADFVAKGADFNLCDRTGNNALLWACANANYKMALAILETRKTDLRTRDHSWGGNTALTLILAQGYEGTDSTGNTSSVHYQQLVCKMVEIDPQIVHIPHHETGLYPVELALCRRDMDMVQLLTSNRVPAWKLDRFDAMTYHQSRRELARCFDARGTMQQWWDWMPVVRNGPYENAADEVAHYIRQQHRS